KQRDQAAAEAITAAWRPLPQDSDLGGMPTFNGLAMQYPARIVRSTLDRETQQRAAAMAAEQLASLDASGINALAVVVLDTATAECLASVSLQKKVPDTFFARGLDLARAPR